MPNNQVHLPLLGNVPKGAVIAGAGAAVVVTGYLIYRSRKTSTLDTAYGYGATAYGYGSQFYGYGSQYADAGGGYGGGYTPYPVGAEYGYGAYGYGYYNPYTGQWIGPTQQQPPGSKPPAKQKGKYVTIGGKKYWYSPSKQTLGAYVGRGKHRRYEHISI